jgi:transposase-like protein
MKGEHMNPPSPPNELQEVQLQEAELERLNDISLPAEQVIAEQSKDAEDALPRLAPRYIP